MYTLKISGETALKMYPGATPEIKSVLEETLGKDFFNQKITDKVKTYEDACKVLGLDPAAEIPFNGAFISKDKKAVNSFAKMVIVARALNEGWIPDWSNSDIYKYYPWFKYNSTGSGLSYDDYVTWYTGTSVGSRLCFKSSELAEYAGKQFIDLYTDFFTI